MPVNDQQLEAELTKVTPYTSAGTESGTAGSPLRTDPTGTTPQPVSQTTASNLNAQIVGNVANAATDSGNPVKVGAVFNSTLPTVANGQRSNLQSTQFGELAISNRNKYTNIAGAATTQVKTGAGKLHTIVINATANATVTVYDNTSSAAPLIATISLTNGVANSTLIYDIEFSTGLRVVTTGAATNITVTWY